MAFCGKCGKEIKEDLNFCPACGASLKDQKTTNEKASDFASDINSKIEHINDTADTTYEYTQEDIKNNKVFAIFAYLGILILVPVCAALNSRFARFHINQGLVLILFSVAFNIAFGIVRLCSWFIPFFNVLINVVGGVVDLGLLVLVIIGIVNAANGVAKELPLIGKIKLLK